MIIQDNNNNISQVLSQVGTSKSHNKISADREIINPKSSEESGAPKKKGSQRVDIHNIAWRRLSNQTAEDEELVEETATLEHVGPIDRAARHPPSRR